MRSLTQFLTVTILLSLALTLSSYADEAKNVKKKDIKSSETSVVNIYDETAGDILDLNVDEYAKKANEAYQAGKYEEAAKYFLILSKCNIKDATSIYNLACCYGLLGNGKLAAKYLERAFNAGFQNLEWINEDKDFDKVRGKAEFDNLLKELESGIAAKKKDSAKTLFINSPTLIKCNVQFPENYNPAKEYPLIIGLHGLGSNADRFQILWDKFATRNFIYATPQAPYAVSTGSEPGFSWNTWGTGDDETLEQSSALTDEYIAKLVIDLQKQYKVSDVYLLGFSQGCFYTYLIGIKHYELFKGLICFGGWLESDLIGEENIVKAQGLRVFIAHGNNDRVVEEGAGKKASDYLKEHGYDVTYFEFEGGHEVPEKAILEVEKWMNK